MLKAMETVLAGRMTMSSAAKHFKVPESTLQYRVDSMHGKNYRKCRVDVFLTREEDRLITKEVHKQAEQGNAMNEEDVTQFAIKVVRRTSADRAEKLATDFTFQARWLKSFMRKHSDLDVRELLTVE